MALDRGLIADALPGYDIGEEIGRGAWGIVLEGEQRSLGRRVAIKQLPRAFAADPAVQARFVAEAKLVASLDHPHIVPVYDYVEIDGLCLLVMEHLTGGTLWSRFTGTGLATDEACGVVMAVCAALHHAHGRGVLHRDVKPENVLFSSAGIPKLADFGIAKVLGPTESGLTVTGTVVGTPAYMSPEQAMGKPLGPQTDVYAVGVILFELLSGSLPFSEEGAPMAQLFQRANHDPRSLADAAPELSPALTAAVDRSLTRDPEQRHPTTEALGVAVAEAAASSFGEGWLQRSGIDVMAGTAILAAAERTSSGGTAAPRLTIRGTATHARLGAAEVSGPAPDASPTVAPRGSGAPPTVAPQGIPTDGAPRRKWPVLIGAGVVALIAAVFAIVALAGGGGSGGSTASSTTPSIAAGSSSVAPLTAEELVSFQQICRSSQAGTVQSCRCITDQLRETLGEDRSTVVIRTVTSDRTTEVSAEVATAAATCREASSAN